jgi:hypothetical protein
VREIIHKKQPPSPNPHHDERHHHKVLVQVRPFATIKQPSRHIITIGSLSPAGLKKHFPETPQPILVGWVPEHPKVAVPISGLNHTVISELKLTKNDALLVSAP